MNDKFTKISFLFVFELLGRNILLPYVILSCATFGGWQLFNHTTLPSKYHILNLILVIFYGAFHLFYIFFCKHFPEKLMKTTEKKIVKGFFPYNFSFYSAKNQLYISTKTGNIGIITLFNPRNFQVVNISDVDRFYVDTQPVTNTTSKGVRFTICIYGKKVHFSTFTTYRAFPMEDAAVKLGIAKAEEYCRLLEKAKKNAITPNA